MTQEIAICLKTDAILKVPLDIYENDFIFVVNGEEFKTNKFISDLLSKRISHLHHSDPTMCKYSIQTETKGNFSNFLNLFLFHSYSIPEEEIPFLIELMDILELDAADISFTNFDIQSITNENVISLLKCQLKNNSQNSIRISSEIEYVSSHFLELCEEKREELQSLPIDILFQITSHPSLHLLDEDQLLEFINSVYDIYKEETSNPSARLYENVNFVNTSREKICEFVECFNFNDMGSELWKRLSNFLINQANEKCQSYTNIQEERYGGRGQNQSQIKNQRQEFSPGGKDEFIGIINYLKNESNGDITNRINITSSPISDSSYSTIYVTQFDDRNKDFASSDRAGSWICFDFKNNHVIPTNYQIRSYNGTSCQPKSWVVEGSNDGKNWEILDSQKNCDILKSNSNSHIFTIQNPNQNSFCYIRMKLTDPTWGNCNHFRINSFEIYGTIY